MARELFKLDLSTPGVGLLELLLPAVLDPLEFDQLNDALLSAIAANPGTRWVIDLAAVTYMGSAVLGLMVNVRQRAKSAGGAVTLCSMTPQLFGVFQACSLHRLFPIHPTRADALASIR
jgi:anti-anti-sigma factor